jgi:hypothetical protein
VQTSRQPDDSHSNGVDPKELGPNYSEDHDSRGSGEEFWNTEFRRSEYCVCPMVMPAV